MLRVTHLCCGRPGSFLDATRTGAFAHCLRAAEEEVALTSRPYDEQPCKRQRTLSLPPKKKWTKANVV